MNGTYIETSKSSSIIYYQNNKEGLQKKPAKDIKTFWGKKNKKKRQYGCERYKNLPVDEKQKVLL